MINKKNKNNAEQATPTLIGGDCVINGNIKNTQAIRVEGTIVGDIEDAGSVIVGESGEINGNVTAATLTVFGHVNGDISANDSIEIKNSGKVTGKLSTQTLSVERGALYEGMIIMGNVSIDGDLTKHSHNNKIE